MLVVLGPLVVLGVVELGLRALDFRHALRERILWKPAIGGFRGTYEFLIATEFTPPGYLWRTWPNTEFSDRHGFRLPELPIQKKPGKVRIAFLGGSTTHGGFRPYPERAIRLLNNALGEDRYEALNVACSSYSTHQSLMALERWVWPYQPDAVFVYHGWNDVVVAGDGYSDREKDAWMGAGGQPRVPVLDLFRNFRLAGGIGWVLETLDRGWPRQRVSFAEFERNLDAMARQCAERGVPMYLMIRPEQPAEHFVKNAIDALAVQVARRDFGTTNAYAVYRAQAERVAAIQRAVAQRHPVVTACDGRQWVFDIVARRDRGEFGERIPIFFEDNCHLFEFADELLAHRVAEALAPQHAEALHRFIDSLVYEYAIAGELIAEESPREALWFIRRALARQPVPDDESLLRELEQKALDRVEFADLFREGRWGGPAGDFETKLAKLLRCAELRPQDFGVMLQLYRLCMYMEQPGLAANVIGYFSAQGEYESYKWNEFNLESHYYAGRLEEALPFARTLLTLQPDHPMALETIQAAADRSR